jgi:hypothetical protein
VNRTPQQAPHRHLVIPDDRCFIPAAAPAPAPPQWARFPGPGAVCVEGYASPSKSGSIRLQGPCPLDGAPPSRRAVAGDASYSRDRAGYALRAPRAPATAAAVPVSQRVGGRPLSSIARRARYAPERRSRRAGRAHCATGALLRQRGAPARAAAPILVDSARREVLIATPSRGYSCTVDLRKRGLSRSQGALR